MTDRKKIEKKAPYLRGIRGNVIFAEPQSSAISSFHYLLKILSASVNRIVNTVDRLRGNGKVPRINILVAPGAPKQEFPIVFAELKIISVNGLDRVDSLKSYTLDNVVPCCTQCNLAKLDYSLDEFKKWVSACYNHLNRPKNDNFC